MNFVMNRESLGLCLVVLFPACIAARAQDGPLNVFGGEAKFETQSTVEAGRRSNMSVIVSWRRSAIGRM
jgi:hypothetical protein